MAQTQIQKLNHRHDGILRWLIAHPDKTLTECARSLGYTVSHVSIIVNSDLFQAVYQEAAKKAGTIATHAVKNRLLQVHALVLDEMEDRLAKRQGTEKFLTETNGQLMEALGLVNKGGSAGNHPAGHTTAVQINVQVDALKEARERLMRGEVVEATA